MSTFNDALDTACDTRGAELKRDLHSDEVEELEDSLLKAWLGSERFDELIDHALEEFELRDGQAFCASLGNALSKKHDRNRLRRLFGGLAEAREKAFWKSWPKAEEGHIGAMKESAMHFAHALDALAGLYHACWQLKDDAGMDATRQQMLRLQARTRPERASRSSGR
jgi:hypothetical protein